MTLPVVVEIIDLNRRKVVHSWEPVSGDRLDRFNVLPDGSLLAGYGLGSRDTVVFRMDACSNVVWEQDLRAHHSFERGVDGDFWSPWRMGDGIIRFSPAGEVLSRITLSGALMRAGHRHIVYGVAPDGNPWRMNDVEPVLQDGPFWRRGDLFVSLRNSSAVLLYRPAADEVLWRGGSPAFDRLPRLRSGEGLSTGRPPPSRFRLRDRGRRRRRRCVDTGFVMPGGASTALARRV